MIFVIQHFANYSQKFFSNKKNGGQFDDMTFVFNGYSLGRIGNGPFQYYYIYFNGRVYSIPVIYYSALFLAD